MQKGSIYDLFMKALSENSLDLPLLVCRLLKPFQMIQKSAICSLLCSLVFLPSVNATTLTVAAYPSVDQIVRLAIPAWKKLHPDVEIEVISREYSDHHTAMTTALATRAHLPDVVALEVGYLGRFINSGGFIDLSAPPYSFSVQAKRFVPYTISQATGIHGGIFAVPGDIGPGALFYREDILRQSGVKPSDLTQSWESYIASGRKIKQATGAFLLADAHDLKDILIRDRIKDGDGLYFDRNGKALVNSPRFQRAFEFAKIARQEKLDGKSKAWSNEWTEMLRSGAVATQMLGAWFGGHLGNWLAPKTSGKWRVANLPDGVKIAWGGTFYAIPAKSSSPQLAYEFIQLLTLNREQQLDGFRKYDAFPALIEAQTDSYFHEPMAFFGGQKARELWRASASQIGAIPVNRLDPIAAEVVDNALDKVLIDSKPIAEALNDAQKQIEYRLTRP
jgi:multiple sugar transport system substrate-binding protein